MAANLFGDRFVSVRQPAWHGLGTVLENPVPAEEAIKIANMDFDIEKFPLAASTDNGYVDLGKIAIMRRPTDDDPEWRYYGIASDTYEVMQNREIAKIIDQLTDVWPVETVGALGKGETMFLSLSAGEIEVKGEPVNQYFLVTDTRDGGTSLKIAFTPVRVVCQNTLVSGLKQSLVSASILHDRRMGATLNARVGLMEQMQQAQAKTIETFKALANVVISDDDAKTLFKTVYPDPPKSKKMDLLDVYQNPSDAEQLGILYDEATRAQQTWMYYSERADRFREGVYGLYEKLNDEYPNIARTPWSAYNAVVEFADYREASANANIEYSALFGSRAAEKVRAFNAALTMTRG